MNPPNGVRGELETDRVEFARKFPRAVLWGFKARRGAWRAAETQVAQSHLSFGRVSAAPAGLEPGF